MKNKLLFIFFFSLSTILFSQELLHCGSDEIRISTLKANPRIAEAVIKRDLQLEEFTQQYIKQKNRSTSALYVIPVVFHVIHNYGNENISDAQIRDGISVLNKTFRKLAADTGSIVTAFKPLHADCEIEFRLAQRDPNGNCTNGINRIASGLTATGDHSVKSLIQWPPDKYLNIYVVQNAAGLAGHAVWPADADSIPSWDGIVISHNYLGSIGTSNPTQSVVLAHECGHYLNLHHIWGGNNVPNFYYYPCADPDKDCSIDDLVTDTPPTIGWQSCNLNGASCGNAVDNVQNAMDYSYCNKMFTYGQKDRMHACLNSPIANRNNLWQTSNLIGTGTDTVPGSLCNADFTSNKTVVCQTAGSNQISFTNTSYNGTFSSVEWAFPGGSPSSSTAVAPTVTYPTAGKYPVSIKVFQGSDSISITKANYISVLPNSGSTYPFFEGFESTTSLNGLDWFSSSLDTINSFELTDSAAFSGSRSVMLNNFNNNLNTRDELYSPVINLTGAGSLNVTFKYAYARKNSLTSDQLQLFVTKDCNNSWVQRINIIGAALETVPPQTTPFFPGSSSDWRQASVSVPVTYLTSGFRFKFLFNSKGGNNLFIDNINVDVALRINDLIEPVSELNIFPNPAKDLANLNFITHGNKSLKISILNVLGQTILEQRRTEYPSGENNVSLDTKNISNGLYIVRIEDDTNIISKKIIISQ